MLTADSRRELLNVILVLVLLLLGGTILSLYSGSERVGSSEQYTEFYVSGPNESRVLDLEPCETGTVTVGITNREFRTVTYRVALMTNDSVRQSYIVRLSHGRTVEKQLPVTTPCRFNPYRLRFLLYRNGSASPDRPYRSLRLWVADSSLTETRRKRRVGGYNSTTSFYSTDRIQEIKPGASTLRTDCWCPHS